MLKPLRERVTKKIGHYSTKSTGFDDLSLLVIYNLAAIYNSFVETPFHTFEDAAAELRQLIAHNGGPFDRVFSYVAQTGPRVASVMNRRIVTSRSRIQQSIRVVRGLG